MEDRVLTPQHGPKEGGALCATEGDPGIPERRLGESQWASR